MWCACLGSDADASALCCEGAAETSRPASFQPDMLSSAERWWEGTIELGLRVQRAII